MVKMNINELSRELTDEEIKEIELAAEKQPIYDSDSPEMTPDMLKQFKRIHFFLQKTNRCCP